MVGGYKEDLEKPQNCQNRGVGTCPGQYCICFTRHAYYLVMHLPEIKYSEVISVHTAAVSFLQTPTYLAAVMKGSMWALSVDDCSFSQQPLYLLVQLYPAPSEGQKSRAATTMKILKTHCCFPLVMFIGHWYSRHYRLRGSWLRGSWLNGSS